MAGFINDIYQAELGRDADQAGMDEYTQLYQQGKLSPREIADQISNSTEGLEYDSSGNVVWSDQPVGLASTLLRGLATDRRSLPLGLITPRARSTPGFRIP